MSGVNSSPNKRKDRQQSSSDDVDDILSSITTKLSALSTVGVVGQSQHSQISSDHIDSSSGEPDMTYLIAVFAEVLQCDEQEAGFFLETAQWDLASAINLCLESGVQQQYTKKNRNNLANGSSSSSDRGDWVSRAPSKYLPIVVRIEGLPEDWMCKVNEYTGSLEFTHLESGHVQSCVPPFFADAPDDASIALLASISEQHVRLEAELGGTADGMTE